MVKTPMDFRLQRGCNCTNCKNGSCCGVSVEGELGCLGSLESGMAGEEDGHGAEGKLSMDQLLTDPEEAARLLKQLRLML